MTKLSQTTFSHLILNGCNTATLFQIDSFLVMSFLVCPCIQHSILIYATVMNSGSKWLVVAKDIKAK
ncbi:hypothetical protein EUGRSUZ_K03527 [Eucalyptus grandis]|uniref:Uncharacterized protein n=2 Tax=Eucalyptus grandis TaxID=71139 RepID=A0A059A9P6_EUCGR|nr:hypothetical protein EUGRSUZ_K03527 [Eucalyptus grandis]